MRLGEIVKLQLQFIRQFAWARRQRRDFVVIESSCHLPTCVHHTRYRLHSLPVLLNVKQASCKYQIL